MGEVSIPAALHKAAEHRDVSFRSLHRVCGTPVEQLRRCSTCEVELAGFEETVRGYEFAEGQFVLVENAELDAALGGKVLELDRFVAVGDIPIVHLSSAYWLAPGKDAFAARAYAVLLDALRDTGLAGLGRLSLYSKERICLVRPFENRVLGAHTLFTAAEVRNPMPLIAPIQTVASSGEELELMTRALAQRARMRFNPRRFDERYEKRILALLEAKIAGEEAIAVPQPQVSAPRDLVDALRRSVRRRKVAA